MLELLRVEPQEAGRGMDGSKGCWLVGFPLSKIPTWKQKDVPYPCRWRSRASRGTAATMLKADSSLRGEGRGRQRTEREKPRSPARRHCSQAEDEVGEDERRAGRPVPLEPAPKYVPAGLGGAAGRAPSGDAQEAEALPGRPARSGPV